MRITSAAFLVLALVGCGPVYRGSGHVVDVTGTPIVGASVCLDEYTLEFWMGDGGSSPPSKHHRFIAATDKRGVFEVETKKAIVQLVEIPGYVIRSGKDWEIVDGRVRADRPIVVKSLSDYKEIRPSGSTEAVPTLERSGHVDP